MGVMVASGVIVAVLVKRMIGVREGSTAIRVSGGGVLVGATVGVACGGPRLQAAAIKATLPQMINRKRRMKTPYRVNRIVLQPITAKRLHEKLILLCSL
jgi:hypothetical protein